MTRDADQASHLLDAAKAIFATRDTERLPEVVVQAAVTVMGADAVTLFLPRPDGSLGVAHAFGLPDEAKADARVVLGEGIAGRIASGRTPVVLNGPVPGGHGRARSSIIYPLLAGDRLIGLLTLNRNSGARPPYSEEDLAAASLLGSQILLTIENSRLARQSAMSDRLAAVGQLAAGIAHEINTPIQFIGDSGSFLRGAIDDVQQLLEKYQSLRTAVRQGEDPVALLDDIEAFEQDVQLDDLREEIPKAIERTLEGVRRVAEIVLAVKSFGRVEVKEKTRADLNQLLQTTVVVARPEYRNIAELSLELGDVPPLLCYPSDLNQVLLNLLVNASHAISDVHKKTGEMGHITVRTCRQDGAAVITISDTGGGIPAAVREKVFEPFFTTKEIGRGTGLGLAIARTIIVDKHEGSLSFETQEGKGTTFSVRLPVLEENP
jgi:signal transduction histidine kinase